MSAVSRARVVIIGGGVVGCAVARAFVERGVADVVVIEAGADVGEEASKANSAIVHTGFDAKAGTIEAAMLRRSAVLWPRLIDELGVPFLAVGALMLARNGDEATHLRQVVAPRAGELGVQTELLDGPAVRDAAPYATDDATVALSIPDESIVDPFWLTRAYAEAAMSGGATILRGSAVTGLTVDRDGATVQLADGRTLRADQVVDAAGSRADDVARLAGDTSFAITPRKGQFLVSEETFGVDRIVLPVPGPMGKGMLVTPIVFGGVLLGPTAVDQADKDDRSTDPAEAERILASCATLVPAMADARPVRTFAGLRPVSSSGDFIMRPSEVGDRLWLACGIRSTGVSASPAIAEAVVADVMAARGWPAGSPARPVVPPPMTFADEPGEVVCLCRGVSRGEIAGACARPLGPSTLDGVKRRGGALFGDCQGNLCAVAVSSILAEARSVAIETIEKSGAGSWMFAGRVEAEAGAGGQAGDDPAVGDPPPAVADLPPAVADPAAPDPPPGEPDAAWDLIVVGGGRGGTAAAGEARAAGLRVNVIDRGAGATVIGLLPDAQDWLVEIQTADGAEQRRARSVLLATGGFVEPREHRPIAGPRPAGIVTADFVALALAAGLRPGRRAVIVGRSGVADRVADALVDAGCEVVDRLDDQPDAVRGGSRLEAVLAGSRWIEADTLVFADRLVAQPFLLRGLGLIDARPGTPAPVDADGRLPLSGLWAAGCCVRPDIDHVACATDGRRVGGAIAAALVPSS